MINNKNLFVLGLHQVQPDARIWAVDGLLSTTIYLPGRQEVNSFFGSRTQIKNVTCQVLKRNSWRASAGLAYRGMKALMLGDL